MQGGAPWLENNTIMGNASFGDGQEAYGGGIQLENSSASLVDNTIAYNSVDGTESYGGGIDIFGATGILLDGNLIYSNTTTDSNSFGYGGGISVRGAPVNLSGMMIRDNSATNEGGGIWVGGGNVTVTASILSGNFAVYGGGIYNYAEENESSVVLLDTAITGNGTRTDPTVMAGGLSNVGGPQGTATAEIYDSQIGNNTADSTAGLYNAGMVAGEAAMLISDSLITGNIATFSNGGISNYGYTTNTLLTIADSIVSGNAGSDGDAGGIYNSGFITLTQVTVTANMATEDGGSLVIDESKAAIFGSTICNNVADSDGENGGDGGGIYSNDGSRVVLEDSTLCGNSAASFGGGIFNFGTLSATNSTFSNNTADDGGALFVEDAASLTTIVSSTLDQNVARQSAGAINNSGVLTVTATTFRGNIAEDASAGAVLNNGEAALTNVTFSGNTAGGFGGALRNLDTLTMTNVTIHGNEALAGDGLYNDENTWLASTILAGNNGVNCDGNPVTSLGHNLEDEDTCNLDTVLNDQIETDPLLGSLGDNGGPTPTHALLPGSPALDAGDNSACPPNDQRGVPRPIDGDGDGDADCDIGAFEVQLATTTSILSDAPDPSAPGEPFTVTVSVTATLGTPTGAVTVTASGDPQSCNTILVGGMGNCALALSVTGSYTLTAAYGGDGTYAPSSATEAHTVEMSSEDLYLPLVMR